MSSEEGKEEGKEEGGGEESGENLFEPDPEAWDFRENEYDPEAEESSDSSGDDSDN